MEGKYTLALDARSVRTVDENGFLHVGNSHITKAKVDPYHGNEVPGWQDKGLDPGKIYYGLRDPGELQKALTTWAGLPLHFRHHEDSADEPAKMTRVGNVGTDITWNAPYVDAPLTIWDQTAIDAINNGTCRELSCAYRYDPDWTPGTYEGRPYDFIMRNIRGNHVALVEEGRAGSDVLVADHQTVKDRQGGKPMADKKTMAKDSDPAIEQKKVDLAQAIIDLHRVDPTTGQIVDVQEDEGKVGALREVMGELASKLAPEELGKLKAALAGLVAPVDDAELEPAANPYKEAMDACGLDSNDEAAQKAFAEGVKFAQSQQPEGDAVLEPAPAPAPEEDDDKVNGTTCANDAKPKDMTMTKQPQKPVVTMDANAIKAQAVRETRQHMQDLFAAVEAVKPLTGSLKPMTFDSADDVYKHALKVKGIDPTNYDRTAWRGMVDMLLMQQPSGFRQVTQDAKPDDFTGPFEHLKEIVIS